MAFTTERGPSQSQWLEGIKQLATEEDDLMVIYGGKVENGEIIYPFEYVEPLTPRLDGEEFLYQVPVFLDGYVVEIEDTEGDLANCPIEVAKVALVAGKDNNLLAIVSTQHDGDRIVVPISAWENGKPDNEFTRNAIETLKDLRSLREKYIDKGNTIGRISIEAAERDTLSCWPIRIVIDHLGEGNSAKSLLYQSGPKTN